MGYVSVINPKYVYTQATQPTGVNTGALWYNTNTNVLSSYDGSTWNTVTADLTYLQEQNLEQSINILINSAGASTTLNDYDDMVLDIFSDADGNDNTLDTGNTTATFVTDTYKNIATATEDNAFALGSNNSVTAKSGFKITVGATAIKLTKITTKAGSGSTKAYLYDGAMAGVLASATVTSNEAVFDYELSPSTTYYVLTDKEGASYDRYYNTGASYPVAGTYLNWIAGYEASDSSSYAYDIDDIDVETIPANKIVQTNAIPITANPVAHQVYAHNTTAGSGTITYNVSFDGGSTWVTDQAFNTKNTSVHAGSSMILKLNLNGSADGDDVTADDYAIMLFY